MSSRTGLTRSGRRPSDGPHPVDRHVGSRVRLRRTMLGMSQEELGKALGLTFQQVQKYENGINRVGASRLFDLSKALDVPISYFFEEFAGDTPAQGPSAFEAGAALGRTMFPRSLIDQESVDLVRAYFDIADPMVRKVVYDLARSLGYAICRA